MQRIAVDATPVGANLTGAGRVVRGLLEALPYADPQFEYVALATDTGAAALGQAISVHRVEPTRGLVWELAGAARAAEGAGAQLLFTVREIVGRRVPPTVLHLFEPPAYRLKVRPQRTVAKDLLLASLLGRSVRRAAAVTAGSETTAAWLRRRFGVEVTVILPGLDAVFFEPGPVAERPVPYLFHVAGADTRDETALVLEALGLLGELAPQLVVAGMSQSQGDALMGRAVAMGIGSKVESLGWVTDEELRAHYRGAIALVHASRYEAYGGLPALESMAVGTPVVALHAPGVTEALDQAAVLIERPDPRLLADALAEVVQDVELRDRLAAAGRRRVDPLRWERAAADLATVFRRVLG